MDPNWQNIVQRLNAYPPKTHRLLPPCPEDRIEAVQSALGRMPHALVDMLRSFNGAKLFRRSIQLISVFGISVIPPLNPLEWGTDRYIDVYTPAWRAAGEKRETEWAIAMMNYGGLIILEENGITKEWDTAQCIWGPEKWDFNEWLENLLREGEDYLRVNK